ncbi:MAG: C4-type zinc ribbon domain-containing protein [Thermodesulfovibrionales bacterium]
MNEQLRLLVELQKLDSVIIEKDRQIRAIPARISSAEKPLRQAEARLEGQRSQYRAAEKKRKDKEMELDRLGDRIAKLKDRTAAIKDNKAYQAHLKEIESAEKEHYLLEDEILALMETLEAEAKEVKEAEKALEAEKAREAELKRELDAEVAEARGKLDALKEKRKEIVAPLEQENYALYMGLLKTKAGLAVCEVRDEVCQGCNMNIMPQLYVEIKKNQEISQCPQCGRILYHPDEGRP